VSPFLIQGGVDSIDHPIQHELVVHVLVALLAAVVDDLPADDGLLHLCAVDVFRVDLEQVPIEDDHVC